MKILVVMALMCLAIQAYAVPYINPKVYADGALGASPDPLQTVLIADNFSHTATISNQIWYDIVYQGAATCYYRLMATNVKATYVQEAIPAGTTNSYLFSGNVKFINYSGCYGTATANSVLHLQ
jgi:hypothetical protein